MLKVAIIGCGNIAGGYDKHSRPNDFYTHVKAYKANKNCRVTAVFDTDPQAVKNFTSTWKIDKGYTNLSQMLEESKPDVVSICSPNQFHCEQIRLCVDAGVKTILCEKPIS